MNWIAFGWNSDCMQDTMCLFSFGQITLNHDQKLVHNKKNENRYFFMSNRNGGIGTDLTLQQPLAGLNWGLRGWRHEGRVNLI